MITIIVLISLSFILISASFEMKKILKSMEKKVEEYGQPPEFDSMTELYEFIKNIAIKSIDPACDFYMDLFNGK